MSRMRIIAHGIDLVEIERISQMLEEHGEHFTERCFTAAERAYAEESRGGRDERYAVRFACKEAVLKALGTGWSRGIAWTELEIRRGPSGTPSLALTGRCAEIASELGIAEWHISLSHTRTHAIASAIACGP
jgi:holo-[acyl-carrier protein] synthase